MIVALLVLCALVMAIIGGMALGYALISGAGVWWQVGGLVLGASALFALAGIYLSVTSRRRRQLDEAALTPHSGRKHRGHSRLGELLVRKHQLITQRQLDQALSRQQGTQQLLGRLLVKMGLITISQLEDVLQDQHSGGRIWRYRRRAR